MPYDVVIRNGNVVDGSGSVPFRSDVAVQGGVIVEVGQVDGRGRREIDAEGHVVTPGFIDGHTHMDAQVFWDRLGTCSCWHGVTTAVMGHCGFTLAPASARDRHLVSGTSSGPKTSRGRRWRPGSIGPGQPFLSTSTPSTACRRGSTTPPTSVIRPCVPM